MDILTYPKTLAHFSLEKIIDPANEKLTTFLKRTMSSIIFQHMKMVHIFQKQKRSSCSFTQSYVVPILKWQKKCLKKCKYLLYILFLNLITVRAETPAKYCTLISDFRALWPDLSIFLIVRIFFSAK